LMWVPAKVMTDARVKPTVSSNKFEDDAISASMVGFYLALCE